MSKYPDYPVNSRKGIAYLIEWARANGMVLYPYHREIAQGHGVEFAGVRFAGPL